MNSPETSRYRRTLPIISVVTFVGFLDTTLLVPVIALYTAELGAGIGITGLIVGLYSIFNTPANVFFGRVIDRVGHRLPLIFGLLGDALAMVLYAICRLPIHLALVRVFHGITGAAVGPATMSALASYSSVDRKGRTMGIYGISIATANLLGFAVSGIMFSRLGHYWLFFFGAAMLLIGASLSVLLPGTGRQTAVADTENIGGFDMVKTMLKRKGLLVAYASIFAQYFSFGGVVTLLPSYLKSLGMDSFHMGMLLTAFSLVFIIIQIPVGALSDRSGRWLPIFSGLSVGIVSLLMIPLPAVFPLLALVMAFYGLAYGLLFPTLSALVADYTSQGERGVATGIFHALLTTGVAIGAPVMGWVGEAVGVSNGLMINPVVMALVLCLVIMLYLNIKKAV